MQRKLKSVFRSSSKKKRDSLTQGEQSPQTSSTRGETPSFEEQRRFSRESPNQGFQHGTRSRPVSYAYDNQRTSNVSGSRSHATDFAHNESVMTPDEVMVHDYKSYLPALSPVEDLTGDGYMSLGGDRRLITGESDGRHEEDVVSLVY